MELSIDEKLKKVTIVLDLEEEVSSSFKSMKIASTHGNQNSGVKYKKKDIIVGCNVYYALSKAEQQKYKESE